MKVDARRLAGDPAPRILVEFEEITSQLQAEEVRNRLAAIVKSSDDAIASKDLNGIITSWNAGAERLFGYTAAEAIGQPVSMLIPPDRENEEPVILDRIRRGMSVDHYHTIRRRKDGSLVDISLSVSPIVDDQGHVIGASKIARDITQQKKIEASQREASQRTREFIAVLAHEIRNPLAPIRNAVHLLRARAGQDASLDSATEMMERQLRLIVRLVDDLLDISRISRGKIELRRERTDLNALVQEVVEGARALTHCTDQELKVMTPDEPTYVDADPARITQVIGNLVNNACKFSGDGGRILVTVEHQGDTAVVRVKDNGVGIAPDKLHAIFDMFSQVDTPLGRADQGLGIGLALAKSLAELHEGSIAVRSDGPGLGSEFEVRLPVGAGDARPPRTSPSLPPTVTDRRILIVDDNEDSATSLAMLLEMMGNETHVAHDGVAAFDAARTVQPDLILLDIGLPRANGYDVCRRIRQEAWGTEVTIIALTGWGQKDDVRRSIEAGFNGHLVKPIEPVALAVFLAEVETPGRSPA
jgi:PAS domain S-box-containing protein